MNKLIILRGLPGSGKTYYSKQLIAKYADEDVEICSADHFFLCDVEVAVGEFEEKYIFDPYRIAEAHEACKVKAVAALIDEVSLIVIDNTHTQHWEFELYKELAFLGGYECEVHEIVVETEEQLELIYNRQQHNVPKPVLLKMWQRWEPYNKAIKVALK